MGRGSKLSQARKALAEGGECETFSVVEILAVSEYRIGRVC